MNNKYEVRPLLVLTNRNIVITDNFSENNFLIRNVPFCIVDPKIVKKIEKQFSDSKSELILGGYLSGNELLMQDENEILWYEISEELILDYLEKRLLLIGPPGSGKSIFTNLILKDLSQKKKKILAIAPKNPNISTFGFESRSIGNNNQKWNINEIGEKYVNLHNRASLPNFQQIILGEKHLLPDIFRLSKNTFLSLINHYTNSHQIKNYVAIEMVTNSIQTILERALNQTLLDENSFLSTQIKALKRLAEILLKFQDLPGLKIDLKTKLFEENCLGIYIDSEIFLPELVYLTLSELYYNSLPCFDIKNQGVVVFIDEIQMLSTLEGVLINSKSIGKIFRQINRQGRNNGILLGGILQNFTSEIALHFFPKKIDDYEVFKFDIKNNRRELHHLEYKILIPPVSTNKK